MRKISPELLLKSHLSFLWSKTFTAFPCLCDLSALLPLGHAGLGSFPSSSRVYVVSHVQSCDDVSREFETSVSVLSVCFLLSARPLTPSSHPRPPYPHLVSDFILDFGCCGCGNSFRAVLYTRETHYPVMARDQACLTPLLACNLSSRPSMKTEML